MSKICKDCKITLAFSEFYKHKISADGYHSRCKKCSNIVQQLQTRTKSGLISRIFADERKCSKWRNHTAPTYTKAEFSTWFEEQEHFDDLYNAWVESDYDKNLSPSVDRLEDSKGYSLTNIRLVTFQDNMNKAYSDNKAGKFTRTKGPVSVIQYTTEGVLIREYKSLQAAADTVGLVKSTSIKRCADGNQNTAKGYVWKYK